MALNLSKTGVDILKSHPEQYFTARQLAEEVIKLKPEEAKAKMHRSKATVIPINNKEALLSQLAAEIGAYIKRIRSLSPYVKTTAERPRKYYYSEKTDAEEIVEAEKASKQNGHPEHD